MWVKSLNTSKPFNVYYTLKFDINSTFLEMWYSAARAERPGNSEEQKSNLL